MKRHANVSASVYVLITSLWTKTVTASANASAHHITNWMRQPVSAYVITNVHPIIVSIIPNVSVSATVNVHLTTNLINQPANVNAIANVPMES